MENIKIENVKDIIFDLCKTSGVSGSEEPTAKLCVEMLSKYADVKIDDNGNVIAFFGNLNADKTILLDAHLDRIGLIVTQINEQGFVKVDACGGIDIRTLLDTALVTSSDENNNFITGVVCCSPPHLASGNEDKATPMDKIWVDFGLPKNEVEKYIKIGDTLTFKTEPKELLNNRITASALDNRCSIAALIKCAELIYNCKKELKYRVAILLSVQEETYGTGAKTGAFSINADESIVVDVSFASQPDISGQYSGVELNKGGMICISPILNREMTNKLISLAKEKNIPFQYEPISATTGTNADHISVTREGVKTALVSIPQRYMHTPYEVIDISDVENTAKLIAEYIISGGVSNG